MHSTKLICRTIGSALGAPEALGEAKFEHGSRLVPVAFFPTRLGVSWYLIIPKGFVALINRHGKYVGVWKAGFHIAPPWMTISHLIPTQYCIFDTPVKQCPTQDNVMVTIDITLIFRIMTDKEDKLYSFCYRLGPDKLDKMLRAFEEDAIRGMARKRKYNEIYDLMDSTHNKQLESTLRDLNNHFNQYGVEIIDISVTNVHLPQEFANTMQEESIWKNRNEYKELELTYNLKQIEFKELEAKQKQKANEDMEQFCAHKQKELAELNKQLNTVKAETNKQIAEINEESKADQLSIQAKSKLKIEEINSKKKISLAKIKSEGTATANAINVETNVYVNTKLSEANKIISKNKAKCLELNANNENEITNLLKAKRQYNIDLKKIDILNELTLNNNTCIASNSNDNIITQLLANQRNANVLGLNLGLK